MALPEYTESEKREAVRAYVMYGTYKDAERVTGIPWETMAGWKHRDIEWWDRTVAEITLSALKDLTDPDLHTLKKIRSSVIAQLAKRVETGDQKLNVKTGELVRVEIPAKELAAILPLVGGAMDGVEPLKDDPTKQSEARQEELARLAEQEREARKVN